MTETEELSLRRDTLKKELEGVREQLAARLAERKRAVEDLETRRDHLKTSIEELKTEIAATETSTQDLEEEWKTARREAAGAKAHLESLLRES